MSTLDTTNPTSDATDNLEPQSGLQTYEAMAAGEVYGDADEFEAADEAPTEPEQDDEPESEAEAPFEDEAAAIDAAAIAALDKLRSAIERYDSDRHDGPSEVFVAATQGMEALT
jgi:hypothetical protein